jgi:pimeloyl-ACP methyl ester carboxylesterase
MSNCRLYGKPPFKIALIHGGLGDPGSLKELAEILSSDYGILEPLQTTDSVNGQIEELKVTVDQYADLPIILIGHSWGAMLRYLFTAKYPTYIQKFIMVGSGLFDVKYAENIMATSLSRLSKEKQNELHELMIKLDDDCNDSDELFHKFGNLMKEADSFDPIQLKPGEVLN